MALIKCTECGGMVSDKASSCPHCGCPLRLAPIEQSNQETTQDWNVVSNTPYIYEEEKTGHKWLYAIVGVLAAALIGLGIWAWHEGLFGGTRKSANQVVGSTTMKDSESPEKNGLHQFRGTIGKYGVEMMMTVDGQKVTGLLHYNSQNNGVNLSLKGRISEDGKIILDEYAPSGDNTGSLEGLFDGTTFKGTYNNFTNGKTFPFTFSTASSLSSLSESDVMAFTVEEEWDDNDKEVGDMEEMIEEVDEGEYANSVNKHSVSSAPQWLQGTWTVKANIMGETQLAKLVVDGNYATFYSDGEVHAKGKYEIYDGRINIGDIYFDIDEEKQLVKADDSHYFSHSSQPTTSVKIGTPAQDEELRIMAQLSELGKKIRELTDELARMRNSGRMDPTRYMYIKQTILFNKDEQIRLARQLNDSKLEYEYKQQKQKQEQAFRMMENGY